MLALVAGTAYWAGTNAIVPPQLPTGVPVDRTYAVEVGVVGRSLRVQVTAEWPASRTLYAAAAGTVTSIDIDPGVSVEPGSRIVSIDLEPVIVAEGSIPMFRTLQRGTQGQDVRQLQALLIQQGHLRGTADGAFGPITEAAVKRWQRSIGSTADGSIGPGSIVFLEGLPVRMTIAAMVGQLVGPGDVLATVLAPEPSFTASIGATQRPELETNMQLSIVGPRGESWPGRLGAFEPLDDGRFRAAITGRLCAAACAAVPFEGQTALSATVVIVPEVRGVVVPTSAIVQLPNGSSAVDLASGGRQQVTVVAEANGFAVVNGLGAGTAIRLIAEPGE